MKNPFSVVLLVATLASSLAQAAEARWYRYYDDKKQPNVTDNVSPEHIVRGYDELTASMQLIKHIPPQRTLTPAETAAARTARDAEALRLRNDKHLLRLYSAPADAEHARNRQLDAIQLRIDFSNSSLTSLRQRRSAEAQRAAAFERTGKPVPNDLKESIAHYDQQIRSAQAEITTRKAEQDKIRAEFAPAIQRLQELKSLNGSTITPPVTTAPANKP